MGIITEGARFSRHAPRSVSCRCPWSPNATVPIAEQVVAVLWPAIATW